MDSELGQCLSGTLDIDPNVRVRAELRIGELFSHPESGLALTSIFVSKDVDIALRQMSPLTSTAYYKLDDSILDQHSAGIVLRKYVKEHWSPYFASYKGTAPPPEAKDQIRAAVFHTLADPASKIRSAAAHTLSLIANSDWPDSYPDLLSNLIGLLSSSSPDAVHGAMQVLTEFIKEDLTEDQILPVLRQLLPILMTVLGDIQRHSPLTRARSVSVFRQCLSALYMVQEQHPQVVHETTNSILPQWIEAFKILLERDPSQDVQNEGNWDALAVRIQVFKTLQTIRTIYPRTLKNHITTMLDTALLHLRILLPAFERHYLDPSATPPTSTEDENVSLPHLVCPIIDFIASTARDSAARPWFDPARMEQLIGVVFHWIQMTADDEENWANNANAFVAQEDDESQDYSLRIAGLDLLACLLDRYSTHATQAFQNTTEVLLEESRQARQRSSPQWWRPLEAALAALGAHATSVLSTIEAEETSKRSNPFDVESLLTTVIPSLLTLSEYPFLQGRCFVFASQYAKRLPTNIASQYLNAAIEVIETADASIPVKISAVKAVRNFCAQVEDVTLATLAPRMIKDLGPLLMATSEDTLALVLEAIGVVIQINDGKWLDVELSQLLSQAILEVWMKNIKDPILLSLLEDTLADLAHSPMYPVVVSHGLPTLCAAITRAKREETWIISSAIDLTTSLVRGAPAGNLGEGFFATLAPTLFECMKKTDDQEILENGIVLLTHIVRKDPGQILSWTDDQGQTGLANVFGILARLLAPKESESGGLVIGDLIIHLLRNAGDAVLPVLPDLTRAMVSRMQTAKTIGLLQSLVIPLAYMIYMHRDSILALLDSFIVEGTQPPKTGLVMFIVTWTENAEAFQGLWSQRISTLAFCSLFLSDHSTLQNLQVKGDMIIKEQTADVIVTRSRAKKTPHEFQSISFPVKALKLVLQEIHLGGDAAAITAGNIDVESDDGDSEWADEQGQGNTIQGLQEEEFAYLSDVLGEKGEKFDEDEDGLDGGFDDEDLKKDAVSTMDMKAHLLSFLRDCALRNPSQFYGTVDHLNAEEMLVVQRVMELPEHA